MAGLRSKEPLPPKAVVRKRESKLIGLIRALEHEGCMVISVERDCDLQGLYTGYLRIVVNPTQLGRSAEIKLNGKTLAEAIVS